jgi:TonB family protein
MEQRTMKRRVVVPSLLIAWILPAVCLASVEVSANWNHRLQQALQDLQQGKPEHARRNLEKISREMVNHLGTGKGAAHSLGLVQLFRAVAESDLGDETSAGWHWFLAVALDPDLEQLSLSEFGENAIALVGAERAELAGLRSGTIPKPVSGGARDEGDVELVPLKVVKRPELAYPPGASAFNLDGKLRVRVMVDANGQVSDPVVVERVDAPTLIYATVENLRQWKIEPARLRGKPVPVTYDLTEDFSLIKW